MKIAIYGGSFNPPHLGHIRVATAVIRDINPDILMIIPDNIPPHKQLSDNSPTPEQRLEMCKIAFGNIPNAIISDIEIKRGGKSYTFDTLCNVKKYYPEAELYLVMGMDMYESFSTWYRPDEILKLAALYVAPRELSSESSSEARLDIYQKGASVMLSDDVNLYISHNLLYHSK